MRRQGPYPDASLEPLSASQVQQLSAQRLQQSIGMNQFPGRSDAFPGDEDMYLSSKAGQWPRSRDGQNDTLPSHLYKASDGRLRPDSTMIFEKESGKDPRGHSHEQDMEIGYEEGPVSQTLENLEKKFLEEIMKIAKQQQDAEDAEKARHRERINEINNQYNEKLMELRSRQANQREEFLRREIQARQLQYQQIAMPQPTMSHYPNQAGSGDPLSHSAASYGGDAHHLNEYRDRPQLHEDAHRVGLEAGRLEAYRDRSQPHSGGRGHGFESGGARDHGLESRGLYPGGRVYNDNVRGYY